MRAPRAGRRSRRNCARDGPVQGSPGEHRPPSWAVGGIDGFGAARLRHPLAGAERILDVAPTRAAAMVFDAMRVASVAGDMQRVAHAGQTAGRLMSSESHSAAAFFAAGIAALLTGPGVGAVAEL